MKSKNKIANPSLTLLDETTSLMFHGRKLYIRATMTRLLLRCLIATTLVVYFLLAGPGIWAANRSVATVSVTTLRTEFKENPLGIDAHEPRLSWQLRSDARGVMQSAYQVRVASSERDLREGRNLVWDSGQVTSDESAHCPYRGP